MVVKGFCSDQGFIFTSSFISHRGTVAVLTEWPKNLTKCSPQTANITRYDLITAAIWKRLLLCDITVVTDIIHICCQMMSPGLWCYYFFVFLLLCVSQQGSIDGILQWAFHNISRPLPDSQGCYQWQRDDRSCAHARAQTWLIKQRPLNKVEIIFPVSCCT